jgi:oligopeptide/dipeptide ABC transporter ATP-binding protein
MLPLSRGSGGVSAADSGQENLIRVRDLKVWFPLRRGLIRELAGGAALWVRAVDGVSFDVRRGEVYCLVGESGCGKTTTGKALVDLVDTTEGDVFLDMPDEEYAAYERLSHDPDDTASSAELNRIRRKYSLTWKERLPWTRGQYETFVGMVVLASLASLFLSALVAAVDPALFSDPASTIGLSIMVGVILGAVAVLPPTRPARATAAVTATVGAVLFNVVPILGAWLATAISRNAPAFDAYGSWSAAWGNNPFGMLIGQLIAPSVAGAISRVQTSTRQRREGLLGIKMRTLRRRMHLIFQDPYESLNPKQSVFEIVQEPLRVNRISSNPGEISALVKAALEDAGIRPAEEFMFRFPHELSGGQRQRVSIAAALVLRPNFIVADEPVSMLDVSIRTEILNLMMQLRRQRDLTYLFITHDLSLAWIIADRVAVMYLGKIVEEGTAEQVIANPKHPYTQALISVVPSPDPRHDVKRTILRGERPDPVDIPTGCRFHPRCPMAFERCGWNGSEVAAELQTVLAGANGPQAVVRDAGEARVIATPTPPAAPTDLAEHIRIIVAGQRDSRLAFRAVAQVRIEGGAVVLELHEWAEPALIELGPGNQVACHLVSAHHPVAMPTPAAPPST